MNPFSHPYFGELDSSALTTSDVIWEREFSLGKMTFEASLWAAPGMVFDGAKLNALAALLTDIEALDAMARQHLRSYLDGDREFIEFCVEDAEQGEFIVQLVGCEDAASITADAFAAAMQLHSIGLWLEIEDAPVVMDYMIDPESSDQILAVKTAQDGQVVAIDWES